MDTPTLLAVFAKQPIAGQTKTRLGAATSHDFAQAMAQAFLEDTLDRIATLSIERVIVYTPDVARNYFAALAGGRFACMPQGVGDLGERLRRFFEAARGEGHQRIVAIGADSPTLPIEFLQRAFDLLEAHDVVLGPAFDGGYYLVGCGVKEVPIFTNIPWSTANVLNSTVERVRQASARLALLPPWYDVDTVDDWAMLCGHVRAMRAAGIDPGVPRTEKLMESLR